MLNSLGVQADGILEQKLVNQKQQGNAVFEQIKQEYNFDEIEDAFDEAAVPHQLDFSYKCFIKTTNHRLTEHQPTDHRPTNHLPSDPPTNSY